MAVLSDPLDTIGKGNTGLVVSSLGRKMRLEENSIVTFIELEEWDWEEMIPCGCLFVSPGYLQICFTLLQRLLWQ